MGFTRLISWATGYVEIVVRGAHLEKLINLLTGSGLFVWDIKRIGGDALVAKIRAHGFLRIREPLRRSGCRGRIRAKKGWPFLWRQIKRRKVFLLGAAFAVMLLIYLSSFIIFIKVEGFEGKDCEILLASLEKRGVKAGLLRKDLLERKSRIEREIMVDLPQAVWLGISVRGVVAEVRVVHRKTAPKTINICDIVAARNGVISKLIVIRGTPVVKEGETVARGDLLISGTVWHGDPEHQEFSKEEVPANGVVEARVWYDFDVLEPRTVWQPVIGKTGREEYSIRLGKKLHPLIGLGERPGKNYSWTRWHKRIYQGRNPVDVVEFIKDTWREVEWRKVTRPLPKVKRRALTEATERLRRLLGKGPLVTKALSWSNEGDFVRLHVTVESVRDIGMIALRQIPPGK